VVGTYLSTSNEMEVFKTHTAKFFNTVLYKGKLHSISRPDGTGMVLVSGAAGDSKFVLVRPAAPQNGSNQTRPLQLRADTDPSEQLLVELLEMPEYELLGGALARIAAVTKTGVSVASTSNAGVAAAAAAAPQSVTLREPPIEATQVVARLSGMWNGTFREGSGPAAPLWKLELTFRLLSEGEQWGEVSGRCVQVGPLLLVVLLHCVGTVLTAWLTAGAYCVSLAN
jgi:hypothetical protein